MARRSATGLPMHDDVSGETCSAARCLWSPRTHGRCRPAQRPARRGRPALDAAPAGLRRDQQVVDDGDHAARCPVPLPRRRPAPPAARPRARRATGPAAGRGCSARSAEYAARGWRRRRSLVAQQGLAPAVVRRDAPSTRPTAAAPSRPDDAGAEQSLDQPPSLVVLQRQVERDLHDSGTPQLGTDPELAAVAVHVGDLGRARSWTPVPVPPCRAAAWNARGHGGRAAGLTDDDPRAGRRVADVIGVDGGLAQLRRRSGCAAGAERPARRARPERRPRPARRGRCPATAMRRAVERISRSSPAESRRVTSTRAGSRRRGRYG